jgi:ATP-dependent DNA ligase
MLALAADPRVVGPLIENDDYYFSQKIDGRRILITFHDGKMIPLNRSGDKTNLPPAIARIMHNSQLVQGEFALDGELIKTSEGHGHLFLFDLPRAGGLISPRSMYEDRLVALEELSVQAFRDDGSISCLPVARTAVEKHRLVRGLLAAHAEGVILRKRGGSYIEGARTVDMLKVKFTKTADCVVIGMGRSGKHNLVLGCFDGSGQMVEVGVVSALTGDGGAAVEGSVVEVTYLHFSPGGKMVQPVKPKLRWDKKAQDCLLDQFTPVNLRALTAVE